MTLWFFVKDTRKQLYKLMMKSSRLLLWSVLLFGFINCKRYFTDTKPDEDSLHVKTDHKILAELGDYEIQHLVNFLNDVNEILLNRGRGEQTKSYSQKH